MTGSAGAAELGGVELGGPGWSGWAGSGWTVWVGYRVGVDRLGRVRLGWPGAAQPDPVGQAVLDQAGLVSAVRGRIAPYGAIRGARQARSEAQASRCCETDPRRLPRN
jgi:hypothetical protein